jgi:hypothetical protein
VQTLAQWQSIAIVPGKDSQRLHRICRNVHPTKPTSEIVTEIV